MQGFGQQGCAKLLLRFLKRVISWAETVLETTKRANEPKQAGKQGMRRKLAHKAGESIMHFLTGRRYRVPKEGLVVIQDRGLADEATKLSLIKSFNCLFASRA